MNYNRLYHNPEYPQRSVLLHSTWSTLNFVSFVLSLGSLRDLFIYSRENHRCVISILWNFGVFLFDLFDLGKYVKTYY